MYFPAKQLGQLTLSSARLIRRKREVIEVETSMQWGVEATVFQPNLSPREVFCLPEIWIWDCIAKAFPDLRLLPPDVLLYRYQWYCWWQSGECQN